MLCTFEYVIDALYLGSPSNTNIKKSECLHGFPVQIVGRLATRVWGSVDRVEL